MDTDSGEGLWAKLGPIIIILAGVMLFMLPLLSPLAGIIAGLIIWPLVYLGLWVASWGFDPTQSLPWWVVRTPGDLVFGVVMLSFIIGWIRGPLGVIALLVFWVPASILPVYVVKLGVAQENSAGWRGYKQEKYVSNCGVTADRKKICQYSPKTGLKLPTFFETGDTEDEWKVVHVTPYRP